MSELKYVPSSYNPNYSETSRDALPGTHCPGRIELDAAILHVAKIAELATLFRWSGHETTGYTG